MNKNTSRQTQLKTIFRFLQRNLATASMVAEATGIPQKNICRFKRDLEKAGRLAEVKKGICPITGFRAWFVTCDQNRFPKKSQLKLF